jgi:hypothetical protein
MGSPDTLAWLPEGSGAWAAGRGLGLGLAAASGWDCGWQHNNLAWLFDQNIMKSHLRFLLPCPCEVELCNISRPSFIR